MAANGAKTPDGVFLIDKPEGITSFDVLRKLKSAGIKDVGHGGTLDPFATGLLLVFSGRALKLSEYFLKSEKEYSATLQFGKTTVSGDFTDPISETSQKLPDSLETIQSAAVEFCNKPYLQTPPMHSAKKVDGKKLYELARQGKEIERLAVSCTVKDFKVDSYDLKTGLATFSVSVSSGTYIRTLAQDVAKSLGTVGMLTTLRRARSGVFNLKNAYSLSEFEKGFIKINDLVKQSFEIMSCDALVRDSLWNGHQEKLFRLLEDQLKQVSTKLLALFHEDTFIGIIKRENPGSPWTIAKTFRE